MPLLSKRPIATLFIDAEPPERATYGGRMARNRRFQHGSLFKRGTRTKVWVARWWEDVSGREGKLERVRRSSFPSRPLTSSHQRATHTFVRVPRLKSEPCWNRLLRAIRPPYVARSGGSASMKSVEIGRLLSNGIYSLNSPSHLATC